MDKGAWWTILHGVTKQSDNRSDFAKRASLVAQRLKRLPPMRETWVRSLGREDPLEKEMATTSVFLPGESYGQRSLAGYSPWGCKSWTRLSD